MVCWKARKVSVPIILAAAQADRTSTVIGQCPYRHAPIISARYYMIFWSTPSARSHPVIGSMQANNWWPIARNLSIVCMRNILGGCWSKWEGLMSLIPIQVKSNRSLLQRRSSGKEIRRYMYITCSFGTPWPIPFVPFGVAHSHTGWKHLASAANQKVRESRPWPPSRWTICSSTSWSIYGDQDMVEIDRHIG